jgi:hypothetical protein
MTTPVEPTAALALARAALADYNDGDGEWRDWSLAKHVPALAAAVEGLVSRVWAAESDDDYRRRCLWEIVRHVDDLLLVVIRERDDPAMVTSLCEQWWIPRTDATEAAAGVRQEIAAVAAATARTEGE